MKKLFFLLTAAVAAMSLSAAPVDQLTAAKSAYGFLTQGNNAGKIKMSMTDSPKLAKAEVSRVKASEPVYYIFTTSIPMWLSLAMTAQWTSLPMVTIALI